MVLFNLEYSHPIISFIVYGLATAFIIAVAFIVNEIIDIRIKDKNPSQRIKIRLLTHFIISFIVIFILYIVLYYLFGFGSNLFPICTYKKFCKNL
jgi:HKD family nuclease